MAAGKLLVDNKDSELLVFRFVSHATMNVDIWNPEDQTLLETMSHAMIWAIPAWCIENEYSIIAKKRKHRRQNSRFIPNIIHRYYIAHDLSMLCLIIFSIESTGWATLSGIILNGRWFASHSGMSVIICAFLINPHNILPHNSHMLLAPFITKFHPIFIWTHD